MQLKSFPTIFSRENSPVLKIKYFLIWCWAVDIPLATSMMWGSGCYWNIHKWINIFVRKQSFPLLMMKMHLPTMFFRCQHTTNARKLEFCVSGVFIKKRRRLNIQIGALIVESSRELARQFCGPFNQLFLRTCDVTLKCARPQQGFFKLRTLLSIVFVSDEILRLLTQFPQVKAIFLVRSAFQE